MTKSERNWFELGHNYTVTFGEQRRKRGMRPPPRFLLLGPSKSPERLRPTIAAGSMMRGNLIVDHGVLGPGLAALICEAYERWSAKRSAEAFDPTWCSCGVVRAADGRPCRHCGDPDPPTRDPACEP